jgi:Na+-translocating ferredoxin:NAD+ oxidoreductase RnfD subunit
MPLIAVAPALLGAVFFFGWHVLAMMVVAGLAGGLVELVFALLRNRQPAGGLLVIVVLFTLLLPPDLHLGVVALGAAIAVFAREIFGGLGNYLFNPVLIGKAVLILLFPVMMTANWAAPITGGFAGLGALAPPEQQCLIERPASLDSNDNPIVTQTEDEKMILRNSHPRCLQQQQADEAAALAAEEAADAGVATHPEHAIPMILGLETCYAETPMMEMNRLEGKSFEEKSSEIDEEAGAEPGARDIQDYGIALCNHEPYTTGQLLAGSVPGAAGTTSGLLMLLAGFWMLMTRTVNWRVSMSILGTVVVGHAFLQMVMPGVFVGSPLTHLFSGAVLFTAFLIAADPVTSPMTLNGKLLYGVGIGLLIITLRALTPDIEGVTFAVLIANAFVPLLDRVTKPRAFGGAG